VGTSQISSFAVGGSGRLTQAPGSPFKAQGLGPFGSEFRPTNPSQLYVSNAHNVGAGTGTVSGFSVDGQGVLSSIGSSPFPDKQTAPCWVQISHDGRRLFAVNTASGTISRYSITLDGTLKLLGTTKLRGAGAVGSVDAGLSPGGRFLYVNESAGKVVAAFSEPDRAPRPRCPRALLQRAWPSASSAVLGLADPGSPAWPGRPGRGTVPVRPGTEDADPGKTLRWRNADGRRNGTVSRQERGRHCPGGNLELLDVHGAATTLSAVAGGDPSVLVSNGAWCPTATSHCRPTSRP
jgi:hypothetical protein